MRISLRKANAIQASINEAIKSIDTNVEISINEFQVGEDAITKAKEVLMTNITRKTEILSTLNDVRAKVCGANHGSGINERLTDVANLEKLIQLANTLASANVREEPGVLSGKLLKIVDGASDRNSYFNASEVKTSVLSIDDITTFKKELAELKKRKLKVQDEILELNIRTEIELSDSTVEILTREGIL